MYVSAKKRERFKHWSKIIEGTVIGLALCTILLAVLIFWNVDARLKWLPLMFLLAALVNVISGIKALYYGRKLAGFALLLASFGVFAFAVVSYIALWI